MAARLRTRAIAARLHSKRSINPCSSRVRGSIDDRCS